MRPIPNLTPEEIELFWSRCRQSDGCWEWTGGKTRGYGMFRSYLAHRVSYKLTKGEPGTLHVCHTCDNPSCIRPDHLWLGTNRDNMRDCASKGRNGRAMAKLKVSDVRAILWSKDSRKVLAERYDVTTGTIGSILRGESWRDVTC